MCSVAAFMLEIEKAEEADGRQLRCEDEPGLSGIGRVMSAAIIWIIVFPFPRPTSSDLNRLEFILKPCSCFCAKGVRSVSLRTLLSAKPSTAPAPASTCNPAAAHKNSHQIIQTNLHHLLQRDTPFIKHTNGRLHLQLLLRAAAAHLQLSFIYFSNPLQ